jgi:hypothetical protein
MSYTLLLTNGSVLTQLVDGTIDQTSTDLTLIGKDANNYGTYINENFIYLLENFANTTSPSYPTIGQLWFDTSEGRLKVYNGSQFIVSGGTIVQGSEPSSFTQGDLWIDSSGDQIHFYDGTNLVLAGPIYTKQQGISGFSVEDIIDTNKINRTIVKVYVAQVLIGILSNAAFTPLNAIPGFTGDVGVGFTVSNYSGVKFNVPVSQADYLLSQDGTAMYAENFVSASNDSLVSGSITIQNNKPLVLGQNQNNEINITPSLFQINSNVANQNFEINLLNSSGALPGIFVNAQNEYVGLYTNTPAATLDVNGNTIIRGNLTVEGSTTTINTTNVSIEDLVIQLGAVVSPSNTTANGGGIVLEGGSGGNKSLLWDQSTASWLSSENFNVVTGKGYYVNGFEVLSQTALGSTVTSAPGLSSVGILSSVQVANLSVTGSTINFVNPSVTNGTIFLAPKNSGTVDVASTRITSVANPTNPTDGANLQTVQQYVQSAPLGLASDTTGLSNGQIASQIITKIYPPSEHVNDTVCRIYCINSGVATSKEYQLVSGAWTWQNDL